MIHDYSIFLYLYLFATINLHPINWIYRFLDIINQMSHFIQVIFNKNCPNTYER